jgi:hypothetical protein
MSTLTTLTPASANLVGEIVGKLNNRKAWVINDIIAVYKADSNITPEHLMVGVKGTLNTGAVYSAWYHHKTGIDLGMLNLAWVGKRYHLLTADSTLGAQITALKEGEAAAVRADNDAKINNGTATVEAFDSVVSAFASAAKAPVSGNPAVGAKIAEMELALASLKAKYLDAVAVGA